MSKLTVHCRDWRPCDRNTLRGFATFYIAQLRLSIADCAVHEQDGKRWVQLPARPTLNDKRELVRDENGKIKYVMVLKWENRDVAAAFNAAAIKAIQNFELGIDPAGVPS